MVEKICWFGWYFRGRVEWRDHLQQALGAISDHDKLPCQSQWRGTHCAGSPIQNKHVD